MKLFLVVLLAAAAVAVEFTGPLQPGVIPVLRREEVRDAAGQYVLEYVSGDGTHVNEQGALKPGPEGAVLARQGSYRYFSPEGQAFEVKYYADETGFHPSAEHLPKSPVV